MARYGMVIDLHRCIGCQACTVACKVENGTQPGVFWTRVIHKEHGQYPSASRFYIPVLCMHCENAPCVQVCPTGASYKRPDGIVAIDYDKCMGCKYCEAACPYGARTLTEKEKTYFEDGPTAYEEAAYAEHQAGVEEKCNFCMERIDEGLRKGLRPGMDREATPACVNACLAKARYFGDLDDIHSNVSELIKEKKAAPLHKEFGTEPSVYYIPR